LEVPISSMIFTTANVSPLGRSRVVSDFYPLESGNASPS
jgi:hypothetical protein